jgi:predicted HNH restriction endonuclease
MKSNVEYVRIWRERHAETWKQQNRDLYQRHRNIWLEFIHSVGYDKCFKCGYDKCFDAIEFHHINPSEKEQGMGNLIGKVMTEDRQKELYKCIPLCANCHRELHRSFR